MESEKALLIFIRNPEKGKVKTRLAATIGEEKALEIYEELLLHTKKITQDLPVQKLLFYAESITEHDVWPAEYYQKVLQENGDLGFKMQAAFESTFANGPKKVIVIGSDCYELTEEILSQAFSELDSQDAVVGPAADGGYYLLGFSRPNNSVFQNKSWSTDSVFTNTIQDLEDHNFKYTLLPVLNDVDEEKDLGELRKFL